MSNQQAESSRREGAGLLATILSDEAYRPSEPECLKDTGLPTSFVEGMVLKRLSMIGIASGRQLSDFICLPFRLVEPILHEMRTRQTIVHKSSAPLNDYNYSLTESGNDRARIAMSACAYVGPSPVPLMDYILSAEAQSIRAESPKREDLRDAFEDITIDEDLFENLGPAINSGAGLFLYGEPGNGKSTLAKCITQCFGQDVWIPRVIIEDGQLIKLFDGAVHEESNTEESTIIKGASYDKRWVKIKRPTVIVGGELTMDGLEIRYDPISNVSEAPLQMKSNCGCLLIDDFGRQRIDPVELLNRWIVPLEARYDFLTLSTGKKIQVPFEQLIIFSTNLDPADLVDEAFLRRIPYKIEIGDPSIDEFHELFEIYGDIFGCEYRPDVIDYLIEEHYQKAGRAMRRCHPRDLLQQIQNFCSYNDLHIQMMDDYFDRVVKSYFSVVIDKNNGTQAQAGDNSAAPATPPPAPELEKASQQPAAPPAQPEPDIQPAEEAASPPAESNLPLPTMTEPTILTDLQDSSHVSIGEAQPSAEQPATGDNEAQGFEPNAVTSTPAPVQTSVPLQASTSGSQAAAPNPPAAAARISRVPPPPPPVQPVQEAPSAVEHTQNP